MQHKNGIEKNANAYEYSGIGTDVANAIEQEREDWLKLSKFLVRIKTAIKKKSLAQIIYACVS